MNNFGLGLIVSCEDNASQGIHVITQAYMDLESAVNSGSLGLSDAIASQVGQNLFQLGDSLISIGSSIKGIFDSLISNVKGTGQEFENFKITLGAIYKDEEIVEEKLKQLFHFSTKSPFDVRDTKDMLVVLKSIGVDAFEQLTSASTGFAQEGLSWITDLMSFKPDIAVSRWKLALTNFLGSGQEKVLQNVLDSGKITDILGREISDTAEGRMQDLMDVASNLGVEGLTDKMSQTLETKLSNLSDFFTQFYYKIADAGAFDQLKRIISNTTSFLIDNTIMTEERLNSFSSAIAEGLTVILDPVERLTEKIKGISVAIVDFVSKHPSILKIGIVFLTVTGSAMILLGVITKLGGAVTSFLASLKYLSGGMGVLSMLRTGLWNILKVFGPLLAAAYLFYKVWDSNIGGIQGKISNTVTSIIDTISLIWDAFSDNTLSEENFQKAEEMGILPLIEGILQLKYHWGFFVEGLKVGVDNFVKTVSDILVKTGILDADVSGLGELIVALIDKMTAPGMTDTWKEVGEFIGEAGMYLLVIISALPTIIQLVKLVVAPIKWIIKGIGWISKAFGTLKTIFRVIKGILTSSRLIGFFAKIGSAVAKLGPIFAKIGSVLLAGIKAIAAAVGSVLSAIGAVVGLPAWVVGLIIAAVIALVALIIIFWDEIKAFFIKVGLAIAEFFVNAWNSLSQSPIVQNIIDIFTTIFNTVKDVITGVWEVVKSFFLSVWEILKSVFNVIKSVVLGAWEIIKSIADLIGNIFYAIYEILRTIVLSAIWVFQQLWDAICSGLEWISELFSTIFNWIYENAIAPIVDAISTAWSWMCDNVFTPTGEFISGIFEDIAEVVNWVCEVFITAFGEVKDFLCNAFQAVADFVTPILDGLAEAISWIVEGVTSAINTVSGWFGSVGDFFGNVGDGLQEAVGLATGGYVKTTGIAVLHPNEVVVNDTLTQRLGAFLSDYDTAKFTSSPLVTQDVIATDDYQEREDSVLVPPAPVNEDDGDEDTPKNDSPMRALVNNSVDNSVETTETSEDDNSTNDNRIIFEAGSVVLQVGSDSKFSDDELYAMADKLMKIMARKMQLRELQTRK